MSSLDFGGVREVAEKGLTPPGTVDIFTIKEAVFENSKNKGTRGLKVAFDRKDDSFSHTFWLSPDPEKLKKMLSRIKTLIQDATVTKLGENESLTEEQVVVKLTNKKIALKVIGKVDAESGKGYPDLGFGGFCKPANEKDFLIITSKEQALIDAALAAIARTNSSTPDSEGSSDSSGSEGGSAKKW